MVTAEEWVQILEEAREIVRRSPDHRPARAAELVAAGDEDAIFTFVRDEIRLQPGWDNIAYLGIPAPGTQQLDSRGAGTRYGARGALRAGSGTAMDRAALLAQLLRDAGFSDAEVVEVPANLNDEDAVRARFLRDWQRPEPDWTVSPELSAIWEASLGPFEEPAAYPPADPTGTEAEALVDALLALLPPDAPDLGRPLQWSWSGPTPIVRFTRNGAVTFADPHDPEAELGTTSLDTSDATAVDVPDSALVAVRLEARSADNPGIPSILVEGSYLSSELIGRQLLISTLPVATVVDWVLADRGSIPAFQPALIVQAADGTDTPDDIFGAAFTLGGVSIEVDGDTVLVDGVAISTGGPAPSVADVASIELTVDASRFPTLIGRGTVLDSSGALVEGIRADQLTLTDGEVLVSTLVRSNRDVPIVSVLIDQSGSMPLEYRGADGELWLADLTAAVLAANPDVIVRPRLTGSDLWTELARAAASGADAVVYLTDGDVSDDVTPEIEFALASGPPAILVEVNDDVADAVLQQMATASNGVVLGVSDPAAAIAAIVGALEAIEPEPYVIEWLAPVDAAGTRDVVVGIGTAEGTATYEAVAGLLPTRFTRLELVIDFDGVETRRVLAGWRGRESSDLPLDDPAQLALWADEVHEALMGVKLLAFEGDRPSESQILDEKIGESIALAPWLEPPVGDLDAGVALLEAGRPQVPSMLTAAFPELQPVGVSDEMTFTGGLRIVLCHARVVGDDQVMIVDHLPTGRIRTALDGDSRALFEANLRRSARLAFVEGTLGTATSTLLAGETLVRIEGNTRPEIDPADQEIWRALMEDWPAGFRIASVDGSVRAFWWIDPDTGELLGVTPAGAGGAEATIAVIGAIKAYFDLLIYSLNAAPSVSAAAAYFAELAKLYAAVSTAILGFVTAEVDAAVEAALRRAACEALAAFVLPDLAGAAANLGAAVLGQSLCDQFDGQPPPPG